jgi:hypothetical protein
VAISTLGVISTLLAGGKDEITMSAWRSRSPDGFLVMTPGEMLLVYLPWPLLRMEGDWRPHQVQSTKY